MVTLTQTLPAVIEKRRIFCTHTKNHHAHVRTPESPGETFTNYFSTSGRSIFIFGILYIFKKGVAPHFSAKMEKLRDSLTWEEFPCTMKTSGSRTPWLPWATRLNVRLSTIATDVIV